MPEPRVERRLAAILAADVAGYSRLMGVDEEGTLAALKAWRRELIDPKIAEHRGCMVKTTGDGALVEFASAVDATRCAVEIQRAMAERNAAIPEDRRIEFRIGINVGDIIIDEETSSATASTWRHGWKGSPSMAVSACLAVCMRMCKANSTSLSRTQANGNSRTSCAPYEYSEFSGTKSCLEGQRLRLRPNGHQSPSYLSII